MATTKTVTTTTDEQGNVTKSETITTVTEAKDDTSVFEQIVLAPANVFTSIIGSALGAKKD